MGLVYYFRHHHLFFIHVFNSTKSVVMNERPEACNFIKKETLAQVFSYEFYEISKNTISYRTPPVAASEMS